MRIPARAALTIILFLTGALFISPEFSSVFSLLVLIMIPVMAVQFFLTGMINGYRWAFQSAEILAGLRRKNIYEMLSLTQAGPFGINWAVSTGTFYRSPNQPETQNHWPVRILIILPAVVFLSAQHVEPERALLRAVLMTLFLGLFVLWFLAEDVQSTALGGVTGILAPTYTTERVELFVTTSVLYWIVQLLAYAAAVMVGIIILPQLYQHLYIDQWYANYARFALSFAAIATIREGAIWLFWRNLTRHIQPDSERGIFSSPRV